MFSEEDKKEETEETSTDEIDEVFDDFESRENIVGLFDLLLKIDRRINPEMYND
jgi:hypothetical protein